MTIYQDKHSMTSNRPSYKSHGLIQVVKFLILFSRQIFKVSLNSFSKGAGNQWPECMPLFVWLIRTQPCNDMCPNHWFEVPLIYLFSSTLNICATGCSISFGCGICSVDEATLWSDGMPATVIFRVCCKNSLTDLLCSVQAPIPFSWSS